MCFKKAAGRKSELSLSKMVGPDKPGVPAGVDKPTGKFQTSNSRKRYRQVLMVGTVVEKRVKGMMEKIRLKFYCDIWLQNRDEMRESRDSR